MKRVTVVTSALLLCLLLNYSSQCPINGEFQIYPSRNISDGYIGGPLQYCYSGTCNNISDACGNQLANDAITACMQLGCTRGTVEFLNATSCDQSVSLYCPSSESCQLRNPDSNCSIAVVNCAKQAPLPPPNFQLIQSNARSLQFYWTPPPPANCRAAVFGYGVSCVLDSSRYTSSTHININSLQPYTNYTCCVRTYYTAALSGREICQIFRTAETAPTGRPVVEETTITSRSLTLRWSAPQDRNGRITNYTIKLINQTNIEEYYSMSTSVTIPNLHPSAVYRYQIAASTSAGRGPFSTAVNIITLEDRPTGHPLLNETWQISNTRSLHLNWNPPIQQLQNGAIRGYMIRVEHQGSVIQSLNSMSTSTIVEGLQPYTSYNYSLAAYTIISIGLGPFTPKYEITTLQDAPSRPPLADETRQYSSARSLHLRWEPPISEHRNGLITGYTIHVEHRHRGATLILNSTHTQIIVRDLRPYTSYWYSIAAFTVIGLGPFTNASFIQTLEDVPSRPPINVTAAVLSSTSLLLEWSLPSQEDRNGPLTGYTVVLEWGAGQERRGDTTDTSYTFTGLQPGTTYHCSIAARTSVGTGPYHNATVVIPTVGSNLEAPLAGVFGAIVVLSLLLIVVVTTCIAIRCYRQKHKTVTISGPLVQNWKKASKRDDKELVSIKYSNKKTNDEESVKIEDKNSTQKADRKETAGSKLVIGTLPGPLRDEVLSSLEAEPTHHVPELPKRSYLEDAEFISKLEDDSVCNSLVDGSVLPELPQRLYLEHGDVDLSPTVPAKDCSRDRERNVTGQKFPQHESQYMSLCDATRDQQSSSDRSDEKTVQYMSLCDATRDQHLSLDRSNKGAEHYMPLSEVTRSRGRRLQSSTQQHENCSGGESGPMLYGKGSAGHKTQNSTPEGHYMSLKLPKASNQSKTEGHYMALN